jgi:hypothetical protein
MIIRASLAILLLAAVAVLPSRAHADSSQANSFAAWRQGDDCARQAFRKFPDYTKDGNAKREAARRECLRQHRLPVSGDPAPQP